MFDQLATAAIDNQSDNLCSGFPNEGIVDLNPLADGCAEKLSEELQDQRMSGASCASSNDLLGNRQINAHDAILEKSNPTIFKQAGDNAG